MEKLTISLIDEVAKHIQEKSPGMRLSQGVVTILDFAQEEAVFMGHDHIGSHHLLLGLARQGSIQFLDQYFHKMRQLVKEIIGVSLFNQKMTPSLITPRFRQAINHALDQARQDGMSDILPWHLYKGVASDRTGFSGGILEKLGISEQIIT